jgi:hypothetical protein
MSDTQTIRPRHEGQTSGSAQRPSQQILLAREIEAQRGQDEPL